MVGSYSGSKFEERWTDLMRKDAETGLYLFMVAAVGEKADLSSIYKLLCINPGLVMAL